MPAKEGDIVYWHRDALQVEYPQDPGILPRIHSSSERMENFIQVNKSESALIVAIDNTLYGDVGTNLRSLILQTIDNKFVILYGPALFDYRTTKPKPK